MLLFELLNSCRECIIFSNKPFFVCVDDLNPSQQFFSHVAKFSCIPGLIQCLAEDKVSCQGHNSVPLPSLQLVTPLLKV